jgi:recombination protein RecA
MAKKVAEDKEKSSSKDRLARFLKSDALSKIHDKFGDSILKRASDERAQDWRRIPTGILPLDLALGGGFPAGVVNTLWGDKGAFKTSSIIKSMAYAQRMCRDCFKLFPKFSPVEEYACVCSGSAKDREILCAFVDVEGTLDLAWCRLLGLDTDRILLSRPDNAEATFDILEGILLGGEIDVIGVDSIAFMTPTKEIEASNAKDHMGVQARAIAKGIRKLTAAFNNVGLTYGHERRPTVFFTNQVRMNLGVMFGNPETQAGGKSAGYSAVTEVKMRPGKYKMDDVTGFPQSALMNFRVDKNKSSFNKVEGEFTLVLSTTDHKKIGESYDEPWLISRGEIVGLITREGGKWKCLDESFGKRDDLLDRLLVDAPFKQRVWRTVLPLALNPHATSAVAVTETA